MYLTGYTGGNFAGPALGSYDAFLVKYDPLGNRIWARQFGTSLEEYATGTAIDALGNAYVAGYTNGAVGGPFAGGSYDMFLAKYDSNGNALWARQLGTASQDGAYDVATDSLGNSYLVGYTEGVMAPGGAGGGDVVVTKFDSAGNLVWTHQFGTPTQDVSGRIAADQFGDLYLSGVTYGNLGGTSNGALDTFVAKYFTNGTADWIYQAGSPAADYGTDVAPDGFGNLYFSGMTEGALAGPSAGAADGFLIKLRDNTFVPEPNSLVLTSMVALVALRARRRSS
jgi:hypothetical protein